MKSLIIAVAIGFLSACSLSSYFSSGPVGKALVKELRIRHKSEVDLKQIVGFSWDELYLYGPYTPREEVCKQFSISTEDCPTVIPFDTMDDGIMTMVFRDKGKIVHAELHYRVNGDFVGSSQPVKPDQARFRVEHDGRAVDGTAWLKLRQIKG